MILEVPHYSQHLDVHEKKWKRKACAVVCIKMLMDAKSFKTPSIDDLIQEGVSLGAFGVSGWIHSGLITLASKYNVTLSRAEWRKSETKTSETLLDEGVGFLSNKIREGSPTMVSIVKYFKPWDSDSRYQKFHIVVLVGIKEKDGNLEGFFYHDPNTQTQGRGKNKFVSLGMFKKSWRRMAIFE